MPEFRAEVVGADRGAYVRIPDDVIDALGGGRRIPVNASFDGVAYRGSITSMGGELVLGMLSAIRSETGKQPGDTVVVTVERDTEPRTVPVPDDLRSALDEAGLTEAFERLSYTHRKENVRSIEEAKRPETRSRRIEQTIARLRG